MVNAPDIDEGGAPDLVCATCGHGGDDHVVRDIEVAGNTIRQAFCEGCDAACDYIPRPEVF